MSNGRDRQVAPADLTDSELLYELPAALLLYARDAHERNPAPPCSWHTRLEATEPTSRAAQAVKDTARE